MLLECCISARMDDDLTRRNISCDFPAPLRIFRIGFLLLLSTCTTALQQLDFARESHNRGCSARIDAAIFGNQPASSFQRGSIPGHDFFNSFIFPRHISSRSRVVFLSSQRGQSLSLDNDGYLTLILMVYQLPLRSAVGPGTTFAINLPRLAGNAMSKESIIYFVGRSVMIAFLASPRHSLLLTMYLYKYRRRFLFGIIYWLHVLCRMYLRYHYLSMLRPVRLRPVAFYLNHLILTIGGENWPKLPIRRDAADAGRCGLWKRAQSSKEPVDP